MERKRGANDVVNGAVNGAEDDRCVREDNANDDIGPFTVVTPAEWYNVNVISDIGDTPLACAIKWHGIDADGGRGGKGGGSREGKAGGGVGGVGRDKGRSNDKKSHCPVVDSREIVKILLKNGADAARLVIGM